MKSTVTKSVMRVIDFLVGKGDLLLGPTVYVLQTQERTLVQREKPQRYDRIDVAILALRAAHGHSFDGPICRESCRICSGGSAFAADFLYGRLAGSHDRAD